MRNLARLNEPDLLAATLAGLVGAAGLWFGRSLEWGTASSMAAGYLPLGISWILVLMAIALFARACLRRAEALARFNPRPAIVIVFATAVFGIALERIGLATTVAIVAIITTYAGDHIPLVRRLTMSVVLSAVCVLLFVYVLGQPIPVWW
jgi:uncharacterized membrane protein YfcA